jgi:hypothetical protein
MLSRSIIASLTRSFLEAAVFATAFGFLFESRLWKLLRCGSNLDHRSLAEMMPKQRRSSLADGPETDTSGAGAFDGIEAAE